jgi:hypothetical protein
MSDTHALLAKISALRQRLDQAGGLVHEARSTAEALTNAEAKGSLVQTERAVAVGGDHDLELDNLVLPLRRPQPQPQDQAAPKQLSARARRVLERGRELLAQLRSMADAFSTNAEPNSALSWHYRDTVAMIDTALRTVALLPDSIAAQLHLCRGLEVTLEEVAGRLRTLEAGCQRLHAEHSRIERLAVLLLSVYQGKPVDLRVLYAMVDDILAEVREGEALRFPEPDATKEGDLLWHVAVHCLTVARVLARIVRHEPELRSRPREAIFAALVHDVGMLGVPPEIALSAELIEGDQRAIIEAHTQHGADVVSRLCPDAPWLAEAVLAHHERLNGTGYPNAVKGNQIRPLGRLLAVADVYTAMCLPRPHRPARSTRTAMADTLLMAEQGQLDRFHAECLLGLSFYPVGSVVELGHGAIGVVVATANGADLSDPARPVVALLTDSQGKPVPRAQHIDMSQSQEYTIVRLLTPQEKFELLGKHFPRWAA